MIISQHSTPDKDFYPRSPCGERREPTALRTPHQNFYPRSPCGERRIIDIINNIINNFYPRSPCGERPPITLRHCTTYLFLSTLSLRRATCVRMYLQCSCRFLSTLSLRRATVASVLAVGRTGYFYPRSPCGERQRVKVDGYLEFVISIHALLAESDDVNSPVADSTSISIHALLAESDCPLRQLQSALCHFYPRSPCGERRRFQPFCQPGKYYFYPRSPCGERHSSVNTADQEANFYPRSPCGERRRGAIPVI